MRKMLSILLLALPAWTLQAQGFYYQSTMPDGRTVIGDKPAPGAKDVKKVPLARGNTSAPLSSPGQQQDGVPGRQDALDSADADVREAERNLAAAKAALAGAREPLPGERIGIKGGGTRLTDAYQQRLNSLEKDVTTAQKQLDDATARRNSAR